MSNRSKYIEQARAELRYRAAAGRLARNSFRRAVLYWTPGYSMQWFHGLMADRLQQVYEGEIKKLMLLCPPQHGKSCVSTRNFPAWLLGKDPDRKVAIGCYGGSIAASFNRDIQKIMESENYRQTFPGTRLVGRADQGVRNTERLDIVNHAGYLLSVGRGGALTGKTVDVGIIDDPLKDREEAQSPTIRNSLWNWYKDVFETRLHNDSAQVLCFTRWDEDDLGGRLLLRDGYYSEANPSGWVVVRLAGLRTDDVEGPDPRQAGEALWPERHSKEKLEKIKHDSPLTFNSLYQQDPRPSTEALVYPDWRVIDSDAVPLCDHVMYGQDFGFTNDPTTLVRVSVQGRNVYLQELIYETGLTNRELLVRMYAVGVKPGQEVYADSAEPKSIEELRRGFVLDNATRLAGLNVKPALKGRDSLLAGINKLGEYIIHYTQSSVNIAREVRRYQWVMQGGKATNSPIDAYNHCFSAEQLITTIEGERAIVEIKAGDFVLTRNGFRPVLLSWKTAENQAVFNYSVTCCVGTFSLSCTSNHEVLTGDGWQPIRNLRAGDYIWTPRSLTENPTTSTKANGIFQEEQNGYTALRSTNTGIPVLVPVLVLDVNCQWLKKADVYNLHVAGDHEFVAGGVLVHNCLDAIRYALFTKYHKPKSVNINGYYTD